MLGSRLAQPVASRPKEAFSRLVRGKTVFTNSTECLEQFMLYVIYLKKNQTNKQNPGKKPTPKPSKKPQHPKKNPKPKKKLRNREMQQKMAVLQVLYVFGEL